MAYISRLILIPLLLFISNSAFAEWDEVYWISGGVKYSSPAAAAQASIDQSNSVTKCGTSNNHYFFYSVGDIDTVSNGATVWINRTGSGSCYLPSDGLVTKKVSSVFVQKVGVCKPGRVYNSNTYQCQDPCPSDDAWQDVESRPGLSWQIQGIYGCNGGCLVRYDVYTDLINFSTNVRGRRQGDLWMCSSDYCFGSEQTSSKCGYRYICPEGSVLNADGSCGSEQCPAGTVSNGAGGCRQECDEGETWDGTSCVLPACPVGQHREDGACVDNQCPAGQIQDPITKDCINPDDPSHQCPAGMAKNLNGECATDSDGDGKPDDSDGDGTPDSEDNDDDNDGTPDWGDSDSDGDGDIDPPNCPEGTSANQYGNCIADGGDNPGDGGDNPGDGGDNPGDGGDNPGDGGDNPGDGGDNPGDGGDNPGDGGGGGGATEGSATSSANCETAPQCKGDPVQCAALKQMWQTGCMLVEKKPDEDQQEKVEFTEIEVSTSIDSGILGGGGGNCPADRIITVAGKQIPISFSAVCQFASLIRAIILLLAGIAAIRIVMGVNVKEA